MLDLTTPQTPTVVEEEFQQRIIASMTRHLLHHDPRPCLLAPQPAPARPS